MRFFSSKPKRKSKIRKGPKTPDQLLNESWAKELKNDPDLRRQLAFARAGHSELLEKDREEEQNKKELRKYVTAEALRKIKEDPELAGEFIESQVDSIMGNKPRNKRRNEPEYLEGDQGSSIDRALEDIESLSELKSKLSELGLNGSGGGFFEGVKLSEILPLITTLMAKQETTPQPQRIYVVRVDGREQSLNENNYQKFLEQGRIKPIAELATEQLKPTLNSPQNKVSASYLELPKLIENVNFSLIEGWLDLEPPDYVNQLKQEVDQKIQESQLIWGFLTTANYDGTVKMISPYKDNPKVSVLIERILSDSGKVWMEEVLELVKGFGK